MSAFACHRYRVLGRALRALAAAALAAVAPAPAAEPLDGVTDLQVKVAFVYNFAKFVEWPPEAFATPSAPLVLCVPQRTPQLAAALAAVAPRPVQGRDLRLRRDVRPDEVRGCHLLLLATLDERAAEPWLRAVPGVPVLTVGDAPGFASSGGTIGFVLRDERVRFEINQDAALRAGLRVSSQLLRLAILVGEPTRRP